MPADFDALQVKGVDRMILERDEDGFFERVVTVHPIALRDRVIDLNPVHRVHEFSLGRAFASDRVMPLLLLPLRAWPVIRLIVRIVREERIDVIRATDAYGMGSLAWILARVTGRPFCVSLHADYDKRFALSPKSGIRSLLRSIASRLPGIVLPRAQMVLPIREHLAGWAKAHGADPAAIRVIPHGIDVRAFERPADVDVRVLFAIPREASIVSFVGRLTNDNYIDDVMAIAEALADKRDDFVLVVAGGGDEESRVAARVAADPRLAARIRLVGFQSFDRVIALRQASAAALCLMAGFSLIEACAAGCPVVTYDVEWHRDLVTDGVNGYVLQERDVDGAVVALERLLNDPDEGRRMGQRGRSLAAAHHDLRATSRIKRECYELLLSAPRKA